MPSLPPKQCSHPGCRELVRGRGRCPEHQAVADSAGAKRKELLRAKHADRYALYRTPEWRRLRAGHLAAHPLCVACGERATVVDHIRPHLGEVMAFLDPANIQSMCKRDHDRKTSREDGGFGNRKREQTV